jgi:hypothetical protein
MDPSTPPLVYPSLQPSVVLSRAFFELFSFSDATIISDVPKVKTISEFPYVAFYDGGAKCGDGFTIDELFKLEESIDAAAASTVEYNEKVTKKEIVDTSLWAKTLVKHKLETMHGYIQWLFPTNQDSSDSRAKAVSDEDRKFFLEGDGAFERQTKMVKALRLMLRFYGLDRLADPEPVAKSLYPTFDTPTPVNGTLDETPEINIAKLKNWAVDETHNHKRLSRILRSSRCFDLSGKNKNLPNVLNVLFEVARDNPHWNLMPVYAVHWEPNYRRYNQEASPQRHFYQDFFSADTMHIRKGDTGPVCGTGDTFDQLVEYCKNFDWTKTTLETHKFYQYPDVGLWLFPTPEAFEICGGTIHAVIEGLLYNKTEADDFRTLYASKLVRCVGMIIQFFSMDGGFVGDDATLGNLRVSYKEPNCARFGKCIAMEPQRKLLTRMLLCMLWMRRYDIANSLLVCLKGYYLYKNDLKFNVRTFEMNWMAEVPPPLRVEYAVCSFKQIPEDKRQSRTDFACNSSELVDVLWSNRTELQQLPKPDVPNPPVISRSSIVPITLVEHLMRNKRPHSAGHKFIQASVDAKNAASNITNMEAVMHSLVTPLAATITTVDSTSNATTGNNYAVWISYQEATDKTRAIVRGRRVVLSASVYPDLENADVMLSLIAVKETQQDGLPLPSTFLPLSVDARQLRDEVQRYDSLLRQHLIYYLTVDQFLLASTDTARTRKLCTDDKDVQQILEQLIGDFVAEQRKRPWIPTQWFKRVVLDVQGFAKPRHTISLEILYHIFLHQWRNELCVLEGLCTNGYVYTLDPPRHLLNEVNDATNNKTLRIFNRIQAAAFAVALKDVGGPGKMMVLAIEELQDNGLCDIYRSICDSFALHTMTVTSKSAIFPSADSIPAPTTSYTLQKKPWALVLHTNGDAFGQAIEFDDAAKSWPGGIGEYSNAYLAFQQSRQDLTQFIV